MNKSTGDGTETRQAEEARLPRETLDPLKATDATWGISGIVENVDVENCEITIWTDEFDELQTVPIHPAMPGWMLHKAAAFRVKIPYRQAEMGFLGSDFSGWGHFEPQPYTHLTEDELLDAIFDACEEACPIRQDNTGEDGL